MSETVDQQDPQAIGAVMIGLRQILLDAPEPDGTEEAARRLTALALFDIGVVMHQGPLLPDPLDTTLLGKRATPPGDAIGGEICVLSRQDGALMVGLAMTDGNVREYPLSEVTLED